MKIRNLISLIICVSLANALAAQNLPETLERNVLFNDVEQRAVNHHPVIAYLEPSTSLLFRSSLKNVNTEAIAAWAGLPQNRNAKTNRDRIQRKIDLAIHVCGESDVYVIASPRSLVEAAPTIVFPCKNPSNATDLARLIKDDLPKLSAKLELRTDQRFVLIGVPQAIQRVLVPEVAGRSKLIEALASTDEYPNSMAIALPDRVRDDLVSLWPEQLPPSWPIEISPRAMARDIDRVTASWRFPPSAELLVTFENTDLAAAHRTRQSISKILSHRPGLADRLAISIDNSTIQVKADDATFAEVVLVLAGLWTGLME
ncbi:hypothetical protein [Rubripirellula reticaptiva]|uniref:Preprotein translocase subunit SecD n=1 Tax=Rubripirellula reticaptiva TaxID=2528013 RepID=A0A5C6EBI5_9BACT|nr:hypothetical protein [Rubripirellula reticaptiva]TWU47123.1 hypothetical protein Poly59_60970 [Rubripirellula reticaptiva]